MRGKEGKWGLGDGATKSATKCSVVCEGHNSPPNKTVISLHTPYHQTLSHPPTMHMAVTTLLSSGNLLPPDIELAP